MKKTGVDFRAVLLAGGSGERFWPLSTPDHPKQFLSVFGGKSLIRQAYERLEGMVSPASVYVVTTSALVRATRRELPEIPPANIVGEPMRRDTGAAIALGVGLAGGDGKTVVGFFPSDQMVLKPVKFRAAVRRAISLASKRKTVVTLGIRPSYPATQFGYVDPRKGVFVEKPNARKAKAYLRKGYLWNAGMFIARAETFRQAFAAHAPQLLALTGVDAASVGNPRRFAALYESLPKVSFDYAVMEKLKGGVSVVAADCGWDDVGSYGAFDRYFPHDSLGNVREGACNIVESENNICISRSARISLLGVKNLVIVTTPEYVLVVDKSRVSEMKKLFRR